MDNTKYQETIQKLTERKFGKSDTLRSKVDPHYPMSSEREFERVSNGYMRLMFKALSDHLPEVAASYNEQIRNDSADYREDGFFDKMSDCLMKAARDFEISAYEFGLRKRIDQVARNTRRSALKDWQKMVRKTIGLDLVDEYYGDNFYQSVEKEWEDGNETAMQGIFNDLLNDIKDIFDKGRRNGTSFSEIRRLVNEKFGKAKRASAAAARDAVSTLSSKYAKLHQTDAGCTQYIWSTQRDSRVRECHQSFEGKIFSWEYPPEMWYRTKEGIVFSGKYCHPGEDYGCRCVAIPVFNRKTFNVPYKGGGP